MESVRLNEKNKLFKHIERSMYDTKGFVDYKRLKSILRIQAKTLAEAVGETTRSIEKNPRSESIQKNLRKISCNFFISS